MTKRFKVDGREVRVVVFLDPRKALAYAKERVGDHAVIHGDAPEFWVCSERDAMRLEAAGYERMEAVQ
jgi:hypothetical protein